MSTTSNPQNQQNIFQRQEDGGVKGKTHGGVWQDNNAQPCISAGTTQPSDDQPPAYERDQSAPARKRHGSSKRQTVQIYGCVRPEVAAEIERLRNQGGTRLSRSSVVAGLLEKAVQGNVDMQYGALLGPVIERVFKGKQAARDARFAALLVRIAYDAGQTRSLVTNLLARAPGVKPELLQTIIDRSNERAAANLTHLSPQIRELIEAVKHWMAEPEEGSVTS